MYDLPADGESTSRPVPPGRPSREQLRAQLGWLSALAHERTLLVPEIIPADDGSLMAYVPSEEASALPQPHERGRQCVLLRWVAGTHKVDEELSPADLSQLGSYVAALHNHAERYPLTEPSAFLQWDWHWAFGESVALWNEGERFYSQQEMAIFEAAAQRVREDLRELGYASNAFGPIHRDLHLGNIVFDGGRPSAIDFDLCGLGHYLLDLVVLLNALRLHALRIQSPQYRFWKMRETFLEGYECERPLPEDYRRYLKTFHAMRRVAHVNTELRARRSEANRSRVRGDCLLRNTLGWLQSNYLTDGA